MNSYLKLLILTFLYISFDPVLIEGRNNLCFDIALKLLSFDNQYNYVSVITDFDQLRIPQYPVEMIRPKDITFMSIYKHYKNIVFDLQNSNDLRNLFIKFNYALHVPYAIAIIANQGESYEILEFIYNITKRPKTIVVVSPTNNNTIKINHGFEENGQNFTLLGEVSTTNEMNSLFNKWMNMRSKPPDTMNIVTFDLPPYSYVIQGSNGPENVGIETFILRSIGESMGKKVQFNPTRDGEMWGTLELEDQTFTGLNRDIYHGHVDAGIGHVFIIRRRLLSFDMSPFYFIDGYCFIVRKPDPVSPAASVVLPFGWRVWISIVLTFFIVLILLLILVKNRNDMQLNTSQIITFVYGSFLEQTWHIQPRSNQLKIFIASFILGALVITSAYKGSVLSFLAVKINPDPPNKIKDLFDYPGKILSFGNLLERKILSSDDNTFLSFAQRTGELFSMDDSLVNVEKGEEIIIDSIMPLEYKIRSNYVDKYGQTKMHLMEECWQYNSIGIIVERNNPFSPIINNKIHQLMEAGLPEKWTKDEMDLASRKAVEKKRELKSNSPLGLRHFNGVFYLIIIILTFCVIIFFIERYLGRKK